MVSGVKSIAFQLKWVKAGLNHSLLTSFQILLFSIHGVEYISATSAPLETSQLIICCTLLGNAARQLCLARAFQGQAYLLLSTSVFVSFWKPHTQVSFEAENKQRGTKALVSD